MTTTLRVVRLRYPWARFCEFKRKRVGSIILNTYLCMYLNALHYTTLPVIRSQFPVACLTMRVQRNDPLRALLPQ